MASIKERNIRRFYYFVNLSIFLVMSITLAISYFINAKNDYERKIELLSSSIINQKKLYLQTIIYEKINDIEIIIKNTRSEFNSTSNSVGEEFEKAVQNRVSENIRNTILPDSGYIWINQILDYSGGENYGIRLVHPNLPDTEGSFLSTADEDIKGNTPYKDELDGINNDGEVFTEYYFKKMNSDEISHKLSYARLYKDFDWVIATGVYLDDIDVLIKKEQVEIGLTYRKGIRVFLITIVFLLILASYLFNSFEKRFVKLINRHNRELESKNKELSIEKDKVEGALLKIQEIAYLDQLTSLWNRRAMYIRLQEEASRSTRTDQKFCLIMGDVDYFKKINDTYGHKVGDFVLKELAGVFSEAMRVEDSIARWGGEEFLFLVNASDLEEGAMVAEKLRTAVERREFFFESHQIQVSMTFGVSEFFIDDNIDQVINSADNKLYLGKNKGRNCVIS